MINSSLLFGCLFSAISMAGPAAARGLDLLGCLPGTVNDVVVEDDLAYCAALSGLLVLDLSTPDPVQFSFLPLPGATVLDVSDGIAYVAGWAGDGLRVVDVSVPSAPTLLATVPIRNLPTDVVAAYGYLYLALFSPRALQVFDVRDPLHPVDLGVVSLADEALGLARVGERLYVAAGMSGLRILDISEPSTPHEVGFCDTPGVIVGVAVEGNYAYLADNSVGLYQKLRVIDIANPAAPVLVGSLSCEGFGPIDDLAVADDLVYMPSAEIGLRVIDVSNPAVPAQVGLCAMTGDGARIALVENTAYVCSGYAGLHIVDVTDPADPELTGRYRTVGYASDVRISGGIGYVGGGDYIYEDDYLQGVAGLATVDISSPARPRCVDLLPIESSALALAATSDAVFLLDVRGNLYAFDVGEPAAPQLLGSYNLASAGQCPDFFEVVYDLCIAESTAIAACGAGGLRLIDIADPAAMNEIGHVDVGCASGAVVRDNVAYVTEYGGSLYAVDVADPSLPMVVDVVGTAGNPWAVACAGDVLYVAAGSAGLQVYSVADPHQPQLLGALDTPNTACDVAVAWPFVYVADWSSVRVCDVSDPQAPVEVAVSTQARGCQWVDVDGGLVLATGDFGEGLFILRAEATTEVHGELPYVAWLEPAAPNPFNPRTTMRFTLSNAGHATLAIYDARGMEVVQLVDESLAAGAHTIDWDGRDAHGAAMPSGTYFCRLETAAGVQTRKAALIR
jgi:hypothetical protein